MTVRTRAIVKLMSALNSDYEDTYTPKYFDLRCIYNPTQFTVKSIMIAPY